MNVRQHLLFVSLKKGFCYSAETRSRFPRLPIYGLGASEVTFLLDVTKSFLQRIEIRLTHGLVHLAFVQHR
jgi:hypothetical protein